VTNLPLPEFIAQIREDGEMLLKAGLDGSGARNLIEAADRLSEVADARRLGAPWAVPAAAWHREQAFSWEGAAAGACSASVPSETECKLMAEIHRYMAERVEGDLRARALYERILLFPVKGPQE
jgi:hypothetical protein